MALLNIAAVDLYRFRIPLIRPIKVGNVLLRERKGLILALTDQKGATGLGEIAPLPGLDKIPLDQCRKDLSAAKEMLLNRPMQLNFDPLIPGSNIIPGMLSESAAHTLFGIESALLSLDLQHGLNDLHRKPPFPDPLEIPVNGLFYPDTSAADSERQILFLKQSGVKTIKVKIGRLPADDEIYWIFRLAETIGKDLKLRLDGNRTLSAETYRYYYTSLQQQDVEYAEEPLENAEAAGSTAVPWPVSLDESLSEYLDPFHPDPAALPPPVHAVILKPGVLQGLHGMAHFMTRAKKLKIKIILSSSFNTGITLAILGAFLSIVNPHHQTAHGLDTLRYLTDDVLTTTPAISDGKLTIPLKMLSEGMHLNHACLEREEL